MKPTTIKNSQRNTRIHKFLALLSACLILAGCLTNNDKAAQEANAIERILFLTDAAKQKDNEDIDILSALENTQRYVSEGNFYRVDQPMSVLGHRLLYVGTMGVDMIPGFNVVLEGDAASIAKAAADKYSIAFQSGKTNYVAELSGYEKLFIEPHPGLRGATIVLRGYIGP